MCRGLAWQEPPAAYSARKRIAEKRVRGKQKHDGAIPSCLCFFMILAVLSHNATIYYQLHLFVHCNRTIIKRASYYNEKVNQVIRVFAVHCAFRLHVGNNNRVRLQLGRC